jgi:hypothetical protein
MRVKSNSRGEAFSSVLDFKQPIHTTPGEYSLSMYTLINCGVVGCQQAGDSISVKVKDGDDGDFKEVYNVTGRSLDDRWHNENFSFDVENDKIYVRQFTFLIAFILEIYFFDALD